MNAARAIALAAIFVAGCGGEAPGADAGVPDLAAADAGFPPPPTLGLQVDRVGRAAVDTLLTDPFYLGETLAMQQANQDAYRAAVDPMNWPAQFAPMFEPNLAIYDGFDGQCGNQFLAGAAGGDAGAASYSALALALADDQLYLDLSRAECGAATNYFSVEARALGMSASPAGCGGRTPLDDAIDATYSALIEGDDAATSGPITDGVAGDGDGAATLDQFPFLTQPN